MKNLGQMMKQAQEMQSRMAEMQAKLDLVEVTGSAGGGLISVTLNGKGELRKIKIDRAWSTPTTSRCSRTWWSRRSTTASRRSRPMSPRRWPS